MATSLPMTAVRQICGASYCLNPRELLESLSKTVPVIPRKEVPCTQNFTEHQHAQAMSSIHSLPCSFPKMIMYACVLSHFNRVQLFAIPGIAPCQAPLCMGFSRQEYWSGLPCPPLGDLPDPGVEPMSLASPDSLPLVPPGKSCRWCNNSLKLNGANRTQNMSRNQEPNE